MVDNNNIVVVNIVNRFIWMMLFNLYDKLSNKNIVISPILKSQKLRIREFKLFKFTELMSGGIRIELYVRWLLKFLLLTAIL